MTISLLHPSRGRPTQALSTFKNWMQRASGLHKIEHILSIDTSDPQHNAYKNQDYPYGISKIIGRDNTCVVEATNKAAALSTGDILIMLSDDFDCPQDWDREIVQAFMNADAINGEVRHGLILKTFDGLQKWIVTLAIMDKAYYNMQGCFYYSEYQHMFCDTDMTHKAELEGRLIVRNDLIFPHNHYSRGKTKKDATNEKADKTWNQGESVYLRRVQENFGLEGVDAMNCSDANNRNWLLKKLKAHV